MTRPEQLLGVPFHAGGVDQALAVRQARRDGDAKPQPPALERKEPGHRRAVGEDGDPGLGPDVADREHEFRGQERVRQRLGAALHGMPGSDLARSQFSGRHDADLHVTLPR